MGFENLKVTRENRSPCFSSTAAPFVETCFAAIRVGLVAVPVNFRLVGAEMAYILQDSGAAAIFHGQVGELLCREPNVMVGCHNQPQATAETIR